MTNQEHPMQERQPLQTIFRETMQTYVGQAFEAAGYTLQDEPMQWLSGRFRYAKPLDDDLTAYIEFLVLVYNDNAWVGKRPSRFRVMLIRSDQLGGKPSQHEQYANRNLSDVLRNEFKVEVVPSDDHWWQFNDPNSLARAFYESGQLIVAYGMPWLAGEA